MGQDKVFQNIRWGLIMVALATVTAEDPLFTCDFETDMCGMEQWKHDDFDWTRHSNRTPTDLVFDGPTGPRGAHVGTYYIYLETSNPRSKDDRAYISTPAIRHSGDICVRFYYNMNGRQIGHLTVFSQQQGENNPVWREEGNKGEAWLDGNVTVKDFTENDKVVFLGQAGNGPWGDIALDYVRIHAGECHDIDECATEADNECEHLCINVEGSYIRATDGRHCIECASVYKKTVETSQIFTSDCPTTSSHTGITLADCLLEACRAQTEVVSYLNRVCHLKLCEEGDLRLQISPGNTGWDIYELDTTWPEANREDDQANTGDHLPLVPVVVGVLAPVVLLVAIVIAVVLLRKRRRTREGSESVHYENDPGHNITDREHDKTPPTTTEVHSAAGIYEEVADPDNKQQVPRNETYDDVTGDPVARNPQVKEAAPNDASEGNTYKNAAFQGDCRYQGLGPDGNPRHYDTIE